MKSILFVRHAQASASATDYDRLSELGHRQARMLARFWCADSADFDRVFVGTLRRQRETSAEIGAILAGDGLRWPSPVALEAFNEHEGIGLVAKAAPSLASRDPEIAAWLRDNPVTEKMSLNGQLKIYRRVTRLWARGEIEDVLGDVESFSAFRKRVAGGVEQVLDGVGEHERGLVITSGGPIAAAVGGVLELSDEKTLELSWVVRNTALTELVAVLGEGRPRVYLRSFNELPHLRQKSLVTFV